MASENSFFDPKNTRFFLLAEGPDALFGEVLSAGSGSERILFRRSEADERTISALEEELGGWEIIKKYKFEHEDLSYDDASSGAGEVIVPFHDVVLGGSYASSQLRGGFLLRGGRFAGIVMLLEDSSSYGMAYRHDEEYGVLLTDGRSFGRTEDHYFHCSTEVDESEDAEYLLRRKTEE